MPSKKILLAGVSVLALGVGLALPRMAAAACSASGGTISANCAGFYIWAGGDLAIAGATISGGSSGIVNFTTGNTLTNSGAISGNRYGILSANAIIGQLSNSGTISSGTIGVYNLYEYAEASIGQLSNSGVISGGNTGIKNANSATIGTISNSGTISGGKIGIYSYYGTIGTLSNSGTITGASDAINTSGGSIGPIVNSGVIAGNILNATTNGLTIDGGSGGTFGTLTGYAGAVGTITGTLANLTFGSGNLVLNDDIKATGYTVVNSGATLQLDGVRTITGNYSQTGDGLVVPVTSASSHGGLSVSGNATLSGGELRLFGTGLGNGETLTIVSAGGTGNYGGATAAALGYTATTATVGNDLVVTLGAPSTTGATSGISALLNQYGATSLSAVANAVMALPSSQWTKALTQLSPSQATSGATLIEAAGMLTTEVGGAIGQHTQVAMEGAGQAGASAGSGYRDSSVWGQVLGGAATRDTTAGADGYDLSSWGLVFGADTKVTPDLLVGGALSWGKGWVNGLDNSAGMGSNVASYQATAYATWAKGPWIVNGMAGVGINDYQESRVIGVLGQTAQAKYSGHQVTMEADTGYAVPVGGVTLTPTAGIRWLRVDTGSYGETGSSENLSVAAATQDQVESSLGAKVAYPLHTPMGRMTPEVKAAWLHDFVNGNVATTAQLAGGSFATSTALPTADGAELSAGVTLAATDTLSVQAEYDGQFRQDYTEHTGMIEVKTRF